MGAIKETLCTRCAHRDVCSLKTTYMRILETLDSLVIDKGESREAVEAAASSSYQIIIERSDNENEKAACASVAEAAVMKNPRFVRLIDISWVKPIIPECTHYLRGGAFAKRGGDEFDR